VPLRLIAREGFAVELLAMATWPVAAPAAVGSNSRLSVTVCPGLRVTGKLAPLIVKPVPVSVAELTVTATLPVEERVTA
jgi:hypothetical protein